MRTSFVSRIATPFFASLALGLAPGVALPAAGQSPDSSAALKLQPNSCKSFGRPQLSTSTSTTQLPLGTGHSLAASADRITERWGSIT